MPDRYDRAECATELRIRSEIIDKIKRGWRPTRALEVPNNMEMQEKDEAHQNNELSDSDTSETSETSLPENIADLYDYV